MRWFTHGDPLFTKRPWIDKTPEQAFWDRIDKSDDIDECWEWTAKARHTFGYGQMFFEGKNEGTHRIAYKLTYGEIPKGMHVRHKCDNPPCCNPNHLEAGYPKQNVADIYKRGRENRNRAKGEKNALSKLTENQVKEIRNLFRQGLSRTRLAKDFSINWSTVDRIVKNRIWKHI